MKILSLALLLTSNCHQFDPTGDSYWFSKGSTSIAVEVSGSWRATEASVKIETLGRKYAQELSFGKDHFPINRHDWPDNNWSRPSEGIVWDGETPLLWCLATELGGVHEVAEILFWGWEGKRWTRIEGSVPDFSNRGSFYVEGTKLRTFDFDYDTRRSHWDSHRYVLREYRVTKASIKLISSRKTKQLYSPEGPQGYPIPELVKTEDDPLIEFGLKWRWWGPKLKG